MRSDEQQTLDQMLLHREFSVVCKMSGNADVYAAIARTTGEPDNGNQYWVQIKDGRTRFEAVVIGDWEFDSMISVFERIYRETAGLLKWPADGSAVGRSQSADGQWLAPNDEMVTLMRVTLAGVTGTQYAGTGEELDRGVLFNFGLHTSAQQLLVHVEAFNDMGMIERHRFDVVGTTISTPTAVISHDALACLMDAAMGEMLEIGLLRHPRRDWVVGYTDLAGRPTVDELDFAVRSIEERLDRRTAEGAIGNGALMVLKSILRFRTFETQHRIDRELLFAHMFAGQSGRAIQEHVVKGHPLEFVFDHLKVIEQADRLQEHPGALALLLIPAAILDKPETTTVAVARAEGSGIAISEKP